MDAAHDDIAALRSALEQAQARAAAAEAEAARAVAQISSTEALIASLRLEIEKLRREIYGQRSERKARLLEQMEFQLEELEASASEDELTAEQAAAKTTVVKAFARQRSSRKPFPAHLPRERVVVPAPSACACCGSTKLAKLGETITETLESIPRQWKVIRTVREKFTPAFERVKDLEFPVRRAKRGAGRRAVVAGTVAKFGGKAWRRRFGPHRFRW
jgi:transposase